MSNPLKIVIIGVSGRMGQMLLRAVEEDEEKQEKKYCSVKWKYG